MPTAIDQFEEALAAQIGRPSRLRPFVCKGNPLACRFFIVGFNPATSMETDFWQFWRTGLGFDRQAWLEAYVAERKRRPLKPGKPRRSILSNTRRIIQWITEEAQPVECLETNLYGTATSTAAELGGDHRLTATFDFLLETIKPRVILTHGKDAGEHFVGRGDLVVESVAHFSRGWSEDAARELGQRIKRLAAELTDQEC